MEREADARRAVAAEAAAVAAATAAEAERTEAMEREADARRAVAAEAAAVVAAAAAEAERAEAMERDAEARHAAAAATVAAAAGVIPLWDGVTCGLCLSDMDETSSRISCTLCLHFFCSECVEAQLTQHLASAPDTPVPLTDNDETQVACPGRECTGGWTRISIMRVVDSEAFMEVFDGIISAVTNATANRRTLAALSDLKAHSSQRGAASAAKPSTQGYSALLDEEVPRRASRRAAA